MKTKHITQLWLIGFAAIALLLFSAGQGCAATVYDSAMSYWKFDNGTANDSKGLNNGTVVGATPAPSGKVGAAYSFDGSDDYIGLGQTSTYATTSGISVSAWIYMDTTGINQWILSNYRGGNLINGSVRFDYSQDNKIRVQLGQGSNVGLVYSSAVAGEMSAGQWYSVIFTYDQSRGNNDRIKLFINGSEKDINAESGYEGTVGAVFNNTDTLKIGSFNYPSGQYFDGSIDEVAIWNSALTQTQVTSLYDMGLIGGGAINTLGFNYTTDQLGQLADLYAAANTNQSLTIGGITWHYVVSTPGTHNIGEGYTDNGIYYIKLGSGLEGDPAVPEPATAVGIVVMLVVAQRRVRKYRV